MASNYHLGYKTNVVRTVSGQEVALSGTGGGSNNIEIDVVEDNVFNLPIGKNPPDEIFEDWHNYEDIQAINDAEVGQRYKYVDSHGEKPIFYIIEVLTLNNNNKIARVLMFEVNMANFDR